MEIKISKNLLIALCAALLIALFALAFLLGRESSKPAATPIPAISSFSPLQELPSQGTSAPLSGETPGRYEPPPPREYAAPTAARQAMSQRTQTAVVLPSSQRTEASFPPTVSEPQTGRASLPPPATGGAAAASAGDAAAILDYFQKMDAIGSAETISGSPQEVASGMLQGAMKGDFSQIDDLILKAERAKTQAQAILPPEICRQFHQGTLKMLEESVQVYRDLKKMIQGGDMSALEALTARTNRLKSEAQKLEAVQKELKARAGL